MQSLEDRLDLDQTLREAGEAGQHLRWSLLCHLGELIRDLTQNVEVGSVSSSQEPASASVPTLVLEEAPPAAPPAGVLALSEYGDEASLQEVRREALQEFTARSLAKEDVVALWLDVVPFWGYPLLLCVAVNVEGYRRILGFAEASLQERDAVRRLLQDLLDRGLCTERGLLWITPGTAGLSALLAEVLGTRMRHQHCQVHKCVRVTSLLPEEEQRGVRGTIQRAYAHPNPRQAQDALRQLHTDLLRRNRSAAQWLLQDLGQTLTVYQSGLTEHLSPSLRTTRCIARLGQHLQHRSRGVRRWLPPRSRQAQIALLLLEREQYMRRLAHASYLSALRTALFASRETMADLP